MKTVVSENRYFHLLWHQICSIVMVMNVFLYDYTVEKISTDDAKFYMVIYIFGLIGCILSLIKITKLEIKWNKNALEKKIDAIYLEVLFLVGGGIVFFFMGQLKQMDFVLFSLSDIMIISGIVAYIMDSVALVVYLSLVRRISEKNLYTNSVVYLLKEVWVESNDLKSIKEVSKKNKEQQFLKDALEQIANGNLEIVLEESEVHGREREMAKSINQIKEGMKEAVSSKMKTEKLKVDLITNVSHDIKTPLTSIVNYVELLQREHLENESANHYIRIIDKKAKRLKQLTEDLVEISKISSGNIKLEMQEIDFLEFLYQIGGEFNEKFERRNLTIVTKLPKEPVLIKADGRQLYRAIENLYGNAAKYAFESTNVYVDLLVQNGQAIFSIKNVYGKIVEAENGNYVDLTERFVRGEASRTTEGSGLGLSIAKSLIICMDGYFYLKAENGMFMVNVEFPLIDR